MYGFILIEQQLYVGVLKLLPEKIASTLLTNFTYGTQAVFYDHWNKWVNNTNQQSFDDVQNRKKSSSDVSDMQTPPMPEKEQTVVQNNRSHSNVNLHDILKTEPYGPSVLSYYKQHGELNEHIRKLLVDAFLFYCTANKIVVTKSICESLAIQIVSAFNGEIIVRSYKSYYKFIVSSLQLFFLAILLHPS